MRACVVVTLVASVLGVVIVPGARSNASDAVVIAWERASAVLGIAAAALLSGLITTGAVDLARTTRVGPVLRVVALSLAGIVLSMGVWAAVHDLPALVLVPLSVVSSALAMLASQIGLRAPHTRAPSIVLGGTALAALLRLVAWQLANAGADRPGLFTAGRVFATVAIAIVGLSQMVSAAWMGARGRGWGQVLTAAALLGAFALVWGAAKGSGPDAPQWQAVLHTALKSAPSPQPFGLDALTAFLTVASMSLGLAALLLRGQVVVVTSTVALALLSRGALDVPMSALASCAASVWLVLASVDDRAMWKDLVKTREDRLAVERGE